MKESLKKNLCLSILLRLAALTPLCLSQTAIGASVNYIDWTAPPGVNYDKAQFRLWYPHSGVLLRGIVVLTPGSDGDGRLMVEEAKWQAFAVRHDLALVGCRFTDKPLRDMTEQVYANASNGSGQALLNALDEYSTGLRLKHFAQLPLFLWGFSAGGQFNYEFVRWKPDRVAGFVVNKGGIYYSALLSPGARAVPGLMIVGGKDLQTRKDAIQGLFAINRRAGALWALVEEPAAGHVVGRSREIAKIFFEDLLAMRLLAPTPTSIEIRPLSESEGFRGDPKLRTTTRIASGGNQTSAYATSWLPSGRMARVWKAVLKDQTLPE